MKDIDIIFISQSNITNYSEYSKLPLERVELFKELIYPRMVFFKGSFRSHLDIFNYFLFGCFYNEATYNVKKNMLNIWNFPGFNGIHIADYLFQFNITTKIINNFDTNWSELFDTYQSCKYKPLIAISTTFHLSYNEIRRISKQIRSFFPDVKIILGGAFINEQFVNSEQAEIESCMRKNKIDYVLHSFNSELDLKNLIITVKKKKSLEEVNNLFFFETMDYLNSKIIKTKQLWNKPILNSVNYFSQFDNESINHTLQIRSSSGCPFACAFCSYPTTAGGFHVQKLDAFEKTMQNISLVPRINKLVFIDDTLNVPKARFKELLLMLKKQNIEWFSFLRVQFINDEIACLMSESGCKAVYLGLESANDIVLKNMNKKATKKQFLDGIAYLKKYNIVTMAAFIIGFPGESVNTIEEDIEFIEDSGIDFYTLKEFFFMKQTSVYKEREKYGLSGIGINWQHNTMNYTVASHKKSEMFRKIKNCIFIDPDSSLWQLAYLYDQGFSLEKIKSLQKEINLIMISQMNSDYSEDLPAFQKIKFLLNN